jgi:hypothetical protein
MTFDMTWRAVPEEGTAAVEDTVHDYAVMREVGAVPLGRRREPSYFQATVRGMGWLVEQMRDLGMVWVASPPSGQLPIPDRLLTDVEWDAIRNRVPLEAEDARAYAETLTTHLAAHPGGCPGIPLYKVYSTNDGWIVTPAEITAALARYNVCGRDPNYGGHEGWVVYWRQWIAFLRGAATHDGFTVR